MAAQFKLYNESGGTLIDSNLISYGLVKSGFMIANGYYEVGYNEGDGYWPTYWDDVPIHAVRVTGIQPIVFCVGRSILTYVDRVGNDWVFNYIGADTSVRFYAYDLMREPNNDAVRFRLWKEDGSISFNSKQWPLNIIESVQVPYPPEYPGSNYETWTRSYNNNRIYAANLPFSRGARVWAGAPERIGMLVEGYIYEGLVVEGGWGGTGAAYAGFYIDPNIYPAIYVVGTGGKVNSYNRVYTAHMPKLAVVDVTELPFPYQF
ncbi:hypothetical protein M5G25_19225 [Pseudomonas sp. TNT2022 ID357]|uniref:Uncharacterized protein n=1 Tax=Pseudomonas idahonensis TaxID=2942628 RepID=A0ABT5Q8S3_9PSED|nr:hypothetical protein [Pseudomonas idahonensis]MDD1150415.1 hypothetical protein [Pseudomonas idahonensis]